MHNGDVYEASIKDIDKKSDIATIKINPQVSQRSMDHCNCDDGFCFQTSFRWCLALFTRFWPNLSFVFLLFSQENFDTDPSSHSFLQEVMSLVTIVQDMILIIHHFKMLKRNSASEQS